MSVEKKTAYSRNGVPYTSPTGVSTTLYPISYLADELGRKPTTIRKWEIDGTIPKTPFRDKMNHRLYAEEHILAIVECAERAQIGNGKPISNTRFTKWCFEKFNEINIKLLGKKLED